MPDARPCRAALAVALTLVASTASGMGFFPPPVVPAPPTTPSATLPASQGFLAAGTPAPRRVAVGARGELLVVTGRGRLGLLTPRGDVMGWPALPEAALAVAAAPGALYVSTVGGRVLQLSPVNGTVERTFELGVATGPSGLAVDAARGLLWMAERNARRLRAIRLDDGATAVTVSALGSGAPFQRPTDVAVDVTGNLVWVAEERREGGFLAHAFTPEGTFVRSAVPCGGSAGQVNRTGGIAVGADGRLHVTDLFAGKVELFAREGTALGAVGSYGTAAGGLRQPSGVALLASGELVVANLDNARLERFGDGAPLPTCEGDADCDGLPDAWEAAAGLQPLWAGDALLDLDGDGLNALEELALGTDPASADTDGDGAGDRDEWLAGTDPLAAPVALLAASDPLPSGPGLVRLGGTLTSPVPCTVAWRQVGGEPIALRDAGSASASFVARRAGDYRFELAADCGATQAEPVQVVARIENVAPRPAPGRLSVVPANAPFTLDGSGSADANDDAVSFLWEQSLGAPLTAGSDAPVLEVAALEPAFLSFQLTATDPAGLSAAAEAPVLVVDGSGRTPVAVAPPIVTGEVGSPILLDGSGSSASAGARYAWSQLDGTPIVLEGAASPVASFVPATAGRYAFQLTVSNGGRAAPPVRVEAFIAPEGGGLPVAVAAPIAAATVEVGEAVALDGEGSEAPSGGALAFRWTQRSGPPAGLTSADGPVATVVPFAPGHHVFELVVEEEGVQSVPATVRLDAVAPGGAPLVAVASAPVGARPGDTVRLDALQSRGPLVAWRWTQVAGPWEALDGAASAVATFHPAVPGTYGFELEVGDGTGWSAPACVTIRVESGGGKR